MPSDENNNAAFEHTPNSSDRSRRMRDAVEAALSDIILLGTEEQVKLAAGAPWSSPKDGPFTPRNWLFHCATSFARHSISSRYPRISPFPDKVRCAHRLLVARAKVRRGETIQKAAVEEVWAAAVVPVPVVAAWVSGTSSMSDDEQNRHG